jgi:hypothetical protein
MPKWSPQGEVVALLTFVVALCLIGTQLFRSTPNMAIFACGVLLAVVALIGFSDSNARPGQ